MELETESQITEAKIPNAIPKTPVKKRIRTVNEIEFKVFVSDKKKVTKTVIPTIWIKTTTNPSIIWDIRNWLGLTPATLTRFQTPLDRSSIMLVDISNEAKKNPMLKQKWSETVSGFFLNLYVKTIPRPLVCLMLKSIFPYIASKWIGEFPAFFDFPQPTIICSMNLSKVS